MAILDETLKAIIRDYHGFEIISRNTSPMNATGSPAITVPCGFSQAGLPNGFQ